MVRRLLDRVPGMKRGQESLDCPIWEERTQELVSILKEKPMTALELCRYMKKTRKWPSLYSINTLAAADIDGRLHTINNKWMPTQ